MFDEQQDKYQDLIALFSPPRKTMCLKVVKKEKTRPWRVRLQNLLTNDHSVSSLSIWATHASDSNTCNKQSAVFNDQQQGFASLEFVQKAIDNQNDRFSRLEHAIKNLISGLHQTRPTSGKKRTRGSRDIQDGDTNLTPAVSARPEDTGSSFPDGSLGSLPENEKTLWQTRGKSSSQG